MNRMILVLALFVSSFSFAQDTSTPAGKRLTAVAESPTTELFDGKTLNGWEGDEKTFRVVEGAIVAGTLAEKIPHNAFLCTEKEYGDFELHLEAKLVGEGKNAGVQFRSRRVPNHFEVSGYQCDIGDMGDRTIWGSLYDESRRNKFLAHGEAKATRESVRKNEWNRIVIRCEGPSVKIWVNEVATVDYQEEDDKIARTGIIGLQIHGGAPAEASYRNIRIRELKK